MGRNKLTSRLKLVILFTFIALLSAGCGEQFIVLDPKGPVAETQQKLIVLSAVLCAIVVIPVIAMLVYIVWRYRDKPGNKASYKPDWNDSKVLETAWWGIPVVIICILGYFTAKDTFALAKPPVSDVKPVTIQVTSLDWKWLFKYPEQNIATVNYVQIPAGVPIHFQLTSDAPMNSFWVPQLAGQVYTMPGMAMALWLQADQPGVYYGTGANFTGEQFAHMRFTVEAKPQAEFNEWVRQVKETAPALTKDGYAQLAQPGTADKMLYSSYPPELFDEIVDKNGGKYMKHGGNPHSSMTPDGSGNGAEAQRDAGSPQDAKPESGSEPHNDAAAHSHGGH